MEPEEQDKQAERLRNAAIRITMMPRDTNAHGTVFGGIILSYIDIAGGVEAVRHTHHDRFVTVAMKEVIFHEPVFVGDLVSFYAQTVKLGNTSRTGSLCASPKPKLFTLPSINTAKK
jgi:acyl-CoA thioesterase YciA